MFSTRQRSLAAIAAVVALLLTGCGGGDKDSDGKAGDDSSSTSAGASGSDDGSDGSGDGSDDGDSGDDGGSLGGSDGKAIDPDTFLTSVVSAMRAEKTAHMTIELGSSTAADADVRYGDGDNTEMDMKLTTGAQTLSVIVVDKTVYVQQSVGGKYMKIDKTTAGAGALFSQFTSISPDRSVAAMKGAVKKVVLVGEEKVDGEELTKYSLTVDTTKVSAAMGSGFAASDLPKTVTYTMYVDGDDLLRRVKMEISGQKVDMKVDDWGEPVDIKAPPASQIVKD